jgi:hypothetical protein
VVFRALPVAVLRKLPLETGRNHLTPPSFSHHLLRGKESEVRRRRRRNVGKPQRPRCNPTRHSRIPSRTPTPTVIRTERDQFASARCPLDDGRCRTAPQRGPGCYAVDRDLAGRRIGPQRRYARWGPVSHW